jgi:hypothetical protein
MQNSEGRVCWKDDDLDGLEMELIVDDWCVGRSDHGFGQIKSRERTQTKT